MNGPFWIGQAVVALDHPVIRQCHPEIIGQVFTVASGLGPHPNPGRMVYDMQERHPTGGFWCFAPDEIKPLRGNEHLQVADYRHIEERIHAAFRVPHDLLLPKDFVLPTPVILTQEQARKLIWPKGFTFDK